MGGRVNNTHASLHGSDAGAVRRARTAKRTSSLTSTGPGTDRSLCSAWTKCVVGCDEEEKDMLELRARLCVSLDSTCVSLLAPLNLRRVYAELCSEVRRANLSRGESGIRPPLAATPDFLSMACAQEV